MAENVARPGFVCRPRLGAERPPGLCPGHVGGRSSFGIPALCLLSLELFALLPCDRLGRRDQYQHGGGGGEGGIFSQFWRPEPKVRRL